MKEPRGSSLDRDPLLPAGTQIITDEVQAAVVVKRGELRRLAPFMRGECSVSQAAADLGLGVTATFKLVQRFVRLGLISEVRREKRSGRDIRYYRAPGAFFVPFALRSWQQVGERNRAAELERFEDNLSQAFSLGREWGLLTGLSASGEAYYDFATLDGEVFDPTTDTSALILAGWNRLMLTRSEARQLQRALLALVLPYLNREAVGEAYQLGIFMTPEGQTF